MIASLLERDMIVVFLQGVEQYQGSLISIALQKFCLVSMAVQKVEWLVEVTSGGGMEGCVERLSLIHI